MIEAEHLCMSLRGVRGRGTRTVTSALHGLLRDDPRSRGVLRPGRANHAVRTVGLCVGGRLSAGCDPTPGRFLGLHRH